MPDKFMKTLDGYEIVDAVARENINILTGQVDFIRNGVEKFTDIAQGTYNSAGFLPSTVRLRVNHFIPVVTGEKVKFAAGVKTVGVLVGFFDTSKKYLKETSWCDASTEISIEQDGFVVILFRNATNTEIAVSDYDAITELLSVDYVNIVQLKKQGLLNIFDNRISQGYWDTDNNIFQISANENWIASTSTFSCKKGDLIELIYEHKTYKLGVIFWGVDNSLIEYRAAENTNVCRTIAPQGAVKFTFHIKNKDIVNAYPHEGEVREIILYKNNELNELKNAFYLPMHLEEKLQQLNRAKYGEEKRILKLLHFSDIHDNTTNLQRVIDFYDGHSNYIDGLIHTGDTVSYNRYPNPFASVGGDMVLNVAGNHDYWDYAEDGVAYLVSTEKVYEKIFAPFINEWGVVSAGTNLCYYYKDYFDLKVRLIILDFFDFNEAQEAWLTSTLEDARTKGYSVIGATHSASRTGVNAIECTFTSIDQSLPENPTIERTPEEVFIAVDTFISNGGEFVCWLCGHAHFDYIGKVVNHENQISITVNTAKADNHYGDEERTMGTKTQDCFNIIAFDLNSKLIKIVRIGASLDRHLRSKETLCLRYTDGSVISNT